MLATCASLSSGLRAGTVRAQRPQQQPRRALVVRAAPQEGSPEAVKPTEAGTYFYKGKSYSEAEWKQAIADGSVNTAAATPAFLASDPTYVASAAAPSLGALMAFSGPAPELINGRLAMLAFVAALGAELSSGESVLRQLGDEPTGIIMGALVFIAASFIPLVSGRKIEAFGPFTPSAEMLNGRAAMIGFASLLVVEAVRGAALF